MWWFWWCYCFLCLYIYFVKGLSWRLYYKFFWSLGNVFYIVFGINLKIFVLRCIWFRIVVEVYVVFLLYWWLFLFCRWSFVLDCFINLLVGLVECVVLVIFLLLLLGKFKECIFFLEILLSFLGFLFLEMRMFVFCYSLVNLFYIN